MIVTRRRENATLRQRFWHDIPYRESESQQMTLVPTEHVFNITTEASFARHLASYPAGIRITRGGHDPNVQV